MNPYKMFETDLNAEKTGTKIEYPGFWFYVARAGGSNEAFTTTLRQRLDRISRGGRSTASTLQEDKISRNTFLEMCLRGWGSDKHGEGVMVGRDDAPIQFSTEAADVFFKELPDLLTDIINQVTTGAAFRKEGVEADAKN